MKNIYLDSRRIKKGDTFIALKGFNKDGNDFIKDALKNGASLILSDDPRTKYFYPNLKRELTKILLNNYQLYDIPRIIGITGTNGKSTLAYSINILLNKNGYKSRLITTIKGIKDSYFDELTTPRNDDLVRILKDAKKQKLDFIVMELSSIGIEEGRINDLDFKGIILTNLESDHLDYHKNLYSYHNSKFSLFSKTNNFIIENDKKIAIEKLNKALNLKLKEVQVYYPKGREEIIHYFPLIIVDYAHTFSAYEFIIKKYKKTCKGRLFVIFGLGGNRDKDKRNKIGDLVFKFADVSIITNDNPRYENPISIIFDAIRNNIDKFYIILNREKAIEFAMEKLNKDDTLLVLGKGHEDHMIIDNKMIPFNDKNIIMNYLYKQS